jgi:hypothetical protein
MKRRSVWWAPVLVPLMVLEFCARMSREVYQLVYGWRAYEER